MSANAPLLDIRDFECVRDGRLLFSNLQIRLDSMQVIALQGANGAGKSTLLRCIAGLYPDFSGSFDVAPLIYSGHKAGLSGSLTTWENLQFLCSLDGQAAQANRLLDTAAAASIEDALAHVGLAGYEEVRCSALSAGQLRRVGLARLLLSRAPVWLLDEPLTALDQAGIALLGAVLEHHQRSGGGAICATHQPLPIESYQIVDLSAVSMAAPLQDGATA